MAFQGQKTEGHYKDRKGPMDEKMEVEEKKKDYIIYLMIRFI